MSLNPVSGTGGMPSQAPLPKSILKKPTREKLESPKGELPKANITWASEKKVRILEIPQVESGDSEDEGWGSAEDVEEKTDTKEIASDTEVPLEEKGTVKDLLEEKGLDSLGKGEPTPKVKTGIVSKESHQIREVDFLWTKAMKNRYDEASLPNEYLLQNFRILEHKMYHLFDEDSDIFLEQSEKFREIVTDRLFQQSLTKSYAAYEEILKERGVSLDPPSL